MLWKWAYWVFPKAEKYLIRNYDWREKQPVAQRNRLARQASVPDERFDKLVEIYNTAKIFSGQSAFVDVHAVGEHPWEAIRQNLSGTDGILHVVDGFSLPIFS